MIELLRSLGVCFLMGLGIGTLFWILFKLRNRVRGENE